MKRKLIDTIVSKSGRTLKVYEPIGEVSNLPSLTVPDQSIPLKVLIERYRRDGTEVLKGIYTGDDDTLPVGFEKLDKMQRIDFMRSNAEAIMQKRKQLDDSFVAERRKNEKAAFDAAVAAEVSKAKQAEGSAQQ